MLESWNGSLKTTIHCIKNNPLSNTLPMHQLCPCHDVVSIQTYANNDKHTLQLKGRTLALDFFSIEQHTKQWKPN